MIMFRALILLIVGASIAAAQPWWHEYTPVASVQAGGQTLDMIQPGAARGVDTIGWYGFWFLDAHEQTGLSTATREKLRQANVKRIVYYDLGEVGDYAGFFAADGRMTHNGWSLPWWKGNAPLTARWFGLDAFMRDVPWAPYPSAKAYHLKPFTTPDGQPADDLYAVLTRRGMAPVHRDPPLGKVPMRKIQCISPGTWLSLRRWVRSTHAAAASFRPPARRLGGRGRRAGGGAAAAARQSITAVVATALCHTPTRRRHRTTP